MPTFYLAVIILMFIIAFLAGLFLFSHFLSLFRNAPYVPTPKRIVRKMLKLADVKHGEKLYDLGSGKGSILCVASKEHGAKAVGVEQSTYLKLFTKFRAKMYGTRVTVLRENFLKTPLHDADVITLFLFTKVMTDLEEKIKKECRPGTRVVSRWFKFPNLEPTKVNEKEKLLLYII